MLGRAYMLLPSPLPLPSPPLPSPPLPSPCRTRFHCCCRACWWQGSLQCVYCFQPISYVANGSTPTPTHPSHSPLTLTLTPHTHPHTSPDNVPPCSHMIRLQHHIFLFFDKLFQMNSLIASIAGINLSNVIFCSIVNN